MRRSSNLPKDLNQLAPAIGGLSTGDSEKASPISAYLSQIGRKGGLKGGKARAEKLSPAERKTIAKKAAKARWKKKK